MAEGFFSRWSQRKEAVRKGEEVAKEPVRVHVPSSPSPQPSPQRGEGEKPPLPLAGEGRGEGEPREEASPPTLEDVHSLTKDSDFTRFTRPDVDPEVKNAAMKKLFSDPHFNTMDGLDVYIDDYGKPDPLPPAMLRQLASAQFLGFFDEEKEKEAHAGEESPTDRASPDVPGPEFVAQSSTRTAQALPPAEDHADPDLRLQQDDAPGREGAGEESR